METVKKIILVILKIIAVIVLLFILLRIIGIGFDIWFWNDIVDRLNQQLGINIYLAKALAIPVAIVLGIGFSYYVLSIRKEKRKKGAIILSAMFIIYFLSMYFQHIQHSYIYSKVLPFPMIYSPMIGSYIFSICSRLFPFVSGNFFSINKKPKRQINP